MEAHTAAARSKREYRLTKPLPNELERHCAVFFEEELYVNGFELLLPLLTSGTVSSAAAFLPPPRFLSLAATLIVHPTTTTRSRTHTERIAANMALQLLKLTNSLVGPIAANFASAFEFTHFTKSRSGARRLIDDVDEGMPQEENSIKLSEKGSLWLRAEDFWHVVGWSFNCAVLHPNRWPRWKLLLEFICDVLEGDWTERYQRVKDLKPHIKNERERREKILCDSMIFKYFKTASSISSRDRRMMRAIFADGSTSAINEFRPIFYEELREHRKENPSKKRVRVNIDENEYGDYDWDSDEDEESDQPAGGFSLELPTRSKKRRKNKTDEAGASKAENGHNTSSKAASGDDCYLGGTEALSLRQRLLALLSDVAVAIPDSFMEVEELYLLYVEFIRHQPLPTFQLLLSPSVLSYFSADAQITICEMLLDRLCEGRKNTVQSPYLTQNRLESEFLPYAATTSNVVDNARISILLESMLRLLNKNGFLLMRPSLKEAVNKGILARASKSQTDTKKGQSKMKTEEAGWTWLIESAERLTYLIDNVISHKPPEA